MRGVWYEIIFANFGPYRDKGQAHENGFRTSVCAKAIKDASIGLLRRLLSICLLAMFGLPFVSPLLALSAKSESNLPACCRRNGQHHCMMRFGEQTSLAKHAPLFQAPDEKCPYCPATLAMIHGDTFLPPTGQAIFAELKAHPAVAAQVQSKLRISRSRSRQKRGPPALLAI